MQKTDTDKKELVTRRALIESVLEEYEKLPPFTSYVEAKQAFKEIFDRLEAKRQAHNEGLADPKGEKNLMAIHNYATDYTLWHTVTTKHVLIFSKTGAFALYREEVAFDPGTEAKDVYPYEYKDKDKKLQYKKLDSNGKNVWGE